MCTWVHNAAKEVLPQENQTRKAQIQLMLPKEQLKVDLKTWGNGKIKPNDFSNWNKKTISIEYSVICVDADSFGENAEMRQYEADELK